MEERSTIADKLLETLSRQRDEGLLTDEQYAARVAQLVRVPTPVFIDPLPDAAVTPQQGVADNAAPVNGEEGASPVEPLESGPPQATLDTQAPAEADEASAPLAGEMSPDAQVGLSESQGRRDESAEAIKAAVLADQRRALEESVAAAGEGAAEEPIADPPQSRRRRFGRRAKAPAAAELEVPAPPPAALPAPGGMSEERLAELKERLLALEVEGWQAVTEYRACGFYSNRLADDGLLVLPDGSVLDKWEAAVSALNGDDTWTSYRIEDERMVLLAAGCAALTYTASARMLEEPEYRAVITSVFVRRGDDWLIALRQETPIHPQDDPTETL